MLHPGPNFRSKAMDRAKVIALHCSSSGTRHWRGALAEALDYRCDLFTPERSNDAGPPGRGNERQDGRLTVIAAQATWDR
jgi:hypothetical protein